MNRSRTYLLLVLCFVLLPSVSFAQSASDSGRPNFIVFMTDDISKSDYGFYGNDVIKTPNLDEMAKEGLVFDNAYLTTSSCSPTRTSFITGRYPHNTGSPELHMPLPKGHYLWPAALKRQGYYTAHAGKWHMGSQPNRAFNETKKGQGYDTWLNMIENRPEDKPFFYWFNSSDAHRGWKINDRAPKYNPDHIEVPPYMVDDKRTRKDFARYYHEVSRTDWAAGQIVDTLKKEGIAENTYFIYLSDNGRPFPRDKTRLYDSGIETPLLIWKAGEGVPDARTDSFVSVIDLPPTLLELAGVERADDLQGVSMTPILEEPETEIRDLVFAEQNWHVFQAHVRMVREGPWVYMRNAWPERRLMSREAAPNPGRFPSAHSLWDRYEKGTLKPAQMDIFLKPRPEEELYHVGRDPLQLHNIAQDPKYKSVKKRLSQILDQWIEETGDTVPDNPTNDREDIYHNQNPDHERGELPGEAENAMEINKPGPIRTEDLAEDTPEITPPGNPPEK